MPVYALGEDVPQISSEAYVHPDATIIGRVRVDAYANIWPGAVLRGDYGDIVVGERTSVQDGTVLHTSPEHPTVVGARCVIGHNAHLEGCVVADECLIGSMATVLQGVELGRGALVGAAALLTPGTVVPAGARALGVPARVVPGGGSPADLLAGVQTYIDNADRYRRELRLLH